MATKPRSIPEQFKVDLEILLNSYNVDTFVGMHDFILAQLLIRFLESMSIASLQEKRLSDG